MCFPTFVDAAKLPRPKAGICENAGEKFVKYEVLANAADYRQGSAVRVLDRAFFE